MVNNIKKSHLIFLGNIKIPIFKNFISVTKGLGIKLKNANLG